MTNSNNVNQVPENRVENGPDKLVEAFGWAQELFRSEDRKVAKCETDIEQKTIPYFTHLVDVLSLLIDAGADIDQQIGGLLHDVIEDIVPEKGAPDMSAQISERFGARVLALVEQCTDGKADEQRDESSWRDRKEVHINHLKDDNNNLTGEARAIFLDGLLISISDKVSNSRAIVRDLDLFDQRVWCRFNAKPENVAWYYKEMLGVYEEALGKSHRMVRILRPIVLEIERRSEIPIPACGVVHDQKA